ncbi:MAG TPA: cell division protein FtsQ/DivIB [Thermohalobaculum sp.]|nr:cell division protein FtsQ/DivIB [Thermohalobaculum sp.]
MRTLDENGAPVAAAPRAGPGPSKLRYRLARAWAKPGVRGLVTVYLPLALLGVAGWRIAADDAVREAVRLRAAQAYEGLATRPEFTVRGVRVEGASPALHRHIVATAGVEPGISSLRLDLDMIREQVETLGPVASARVRIAPDGLLEIAVGERIARVLWRTPEGELALLDDEGVRIGTVARRAARADLPLILGQGASMRVAEALRLAAAAPDLMGRLRALVLVGERRWDLALGGGMTVMLPEEGPVPALMRVMALHRAEELLDRDVGVVDMRLSDRPALRLSPEAIERYREVAEGGEKT